MSPPLLDVRGLVKEFAVRIPGHRRSRFRAVDDVSFSVAQGEALGLVGESGSGKSTTARCILRLIEPTSGEIHFAGKDVTRVRGSELRRIRRSMQMVFQDPYSSLDPRMRVEDLVGEGLVIHGLVRDAGQRRERVVELLELVGLREEHLRRRSASFSGGQRQRIGIARALAVNPQLLVCDEPVASLDVSIQAQILNLFKDLQRELRLTIVFIAHDLATVRQLCDRVAVMQQGQIKEIGPRDQIYGSPTHAYTKELMDAVPVPDPRVERERQRRRVEQHDAHRSVDRHAGAGLVGDRGRTP